MSDNDNYEGIFDDATVEDFMRDTSAKVVTESQAGGLDAFDRFIDEQLRAVRMAWLAAETYMQPLALLCNAREQRVFTPDDDESLRQFVDRLHREAVAMEATWTFVAKRSMVANLGPALETDDDVDVSDPDEWEKAVAAGVIRLGVVWYGERVDGTERLFRHGQMQDEEGTLGEMREGSRNQSIPLFAAILGA